MIGSLRSHGHAFCDYAAAGTGCIEAVTVTPVSTTPTVEAHERMLPPFFFLHF
jgi:hypothetical protein